jgi:sodium transport system permease protein
MNVPPSVRWRLVWTIFCKEITEALRDRMTLLVMFGLPLLLYPTMIIVISKVQRTQAATEDRRISRVQVWGELPAGALARLQSTNTLIVAPAWKGAPLQLRRDLESGAIAPPPAARPESEAAMWGQPRETNSGPAPVLSAAARETIAKGEADAIVVVWPGFSSTLESNGLAKAAILYDSVKPASMKANWRVYDELQSFRRDLVRQRIKERGLGEGFSSGFELRNENIAPPRRKVGQSLGIILPFILVMLSATGALYASIDLTAGEKDRATMQTLLCAPVHSLEIVLGKFLTIWAVSLLGALVNSVSLGGTFARMSGVAGEGMHLSPLTLLAAFGCLLPMTCTISAFFLAVAMLARDAKDAGHFLGTSLSVVMMPMGVTMVPGVELTPATCFVPLVNIALLIKALFIGEARGDLVFIALLGAGLYAALALLLAARTFSREQVLLGGKGAVWSLFERQRRGAGQPTPAVSAVTFAIILVAAFYGSMAFENAGMASMIVATQYGCFLLPVLGLAWLMRFPLRETFSLRLPDWRSVLGCLLLGASSGLAIGGIALRLMPAPESLAKGMQKVLLLGDTPAPLWLILAVVSLTPAFCEEMVFRGLILSGLRRWGPAAAIGLSALLFGLAHSSIYRLLPTFGLGIVLGYAAWRTRSLVCSMLVHALNNGLIATLVYHEALANRLHVTEMTAVPWSVTFGAAAVMAVGLWLLRPPRADVQSSIPSDKSRW